MKKASYKLSGSNISCGISAMLSFSFPKGMKFLNGHVHIMTGTVLSYNGQHRAVIINSQLYMSQNEVAIPSILKINLSGLQLIIMLQ